MAAYSAGISLLLSECPNSDQFVNTYSSRPYSSCSIPYGSLSTLAVSFVSGNNNPHHLKSLSSLSRFQRLSFKAVSHRRGFWHVEGCKWLQCCRLFDGINRQISCACDCKRGKSFSKIRSNKGFGQSQVQDFIDSNRCRYTFTGQIQSARINPEGGENFSYINSPENSQRVSDPDGGDSLDHSLDGEGALQGEVVKSVANLSSISTDLKDSGVDSSVLHLRELLHVSREDFQDARVNSAQLEEKARMVAEKAIALKDQAIDAEGAADSARLRLERLLADESAAEVALQDAKSAFSAAVLQMKLAQESVEQACRRFEEMNISKSADHHSMGAVVEIVERPDHDNAEDKCENISDNVAGALNLNTEKANVEGIYESLARETVLSEESASVSDTIIKEKEVLQAAQAELSAREKDFAKSEAELFQIQKAVQELKEELTQLNEVALRVRAFAVAAEEDVGTAMSMAEKAVALELEAAQKLNDAEITVQKAESFTLDTVEVVAVPERTEKQEMTVTHVVEAFSEDEKANLEMTSHEADGRPRNSTVEMVVEDGKGLFLNEAAKETLKASFSEEVLEVLTKNTDSEKPAIPGLFVETKAKDFSAENRKLNLSIPKEGGDEKIKTAPQLKKVEMLKEVGEPGIIKACMKKSSRFFPASFFSLEDGEEFSPKRVFSGFLANLRHFFPTLFIGLLLVGAGGAYFNNRLEKRASLFESPEITSSIEDVAINTRPLIKKLGRIPSKLRKFINELPLEIHEEEASLFDVLWLLLASVIFVPIFQKIPGGSPVLGYLAAGVLIGPHCLHIIRHVHGTKAIAEFGVVFLLFNIGLELSVERLSSMKKYVFGFGSSQVFSTAIVAGLFVHYVSGITVPAAIILGNGLALSSTAVVLQVLQERGESTSRHGRAAFSVLLFQDLAVVVLLILIPLISPNSSKGGVGVQAIAEALGIAAVKAVIAITGIIGGCRLLLRPIYKRMAENHNAEIFAANTLLVVLGTSVLTARAGLSMALGAFLAGLLLAETEFALQVESDIAPYRGLLLGLFFMTVGMSIDPRLFLAKFPVILGGLALLIGGKTLLITALGRQFGLSTVAALRSGLLLAPGGEFAFVAFGEAVNHGILSSQMSSLLFLVVGLSMALTPWLAAGGQLLASRFERHDVRNLLPAENETDDLQGHMIICGFGRVGQIIAQLLSESLIPFVALDMRSERVSAGRALDLPVYFGDAGSKEVLHKLGAERAAAAVITLDTPGASYRAVWALSKHFPHVKTFVRAHDIDHGLILEKAGATAVVPETLEPSLQLASALLAQAKLPASEIATTIDEFRSRHLSELTELSETSGTSLGYGFSRIMAKPRPPIFDVPSKKVDDDGSSDKRVGGLVIAVP